MGMFFIHTPPDKVDAEYIANAGAQCPYCESEDITFVETHEMAEEVRCKECDEHWLELHRIVGILLHEPMEVSK